MAAINWSKNETAGNGHEEAGELQKAITLLERSVTALCTFRQFHGRFRRFRRSSN
jgi:hypothetical protein